MKEDEFIGRRIVVTGGASGIGSATASGLRALGAQVTIFDLYATPPLAAEIGAHAVKVDVADEDSVAAGMQAAAAAMGGIDGVVNAAGVVSLAGVAETSLSAWSRMIAINLTGTFLVCRAAAPYLLAEPGSTIVNVASGQALLPRRNSSAYAASKGGVVSLTKALAVDLAPKVRANVVCPGMVDTPMTLGMLSPEQLDEVKLRYALQRVALPEDIANAIMFLSSAASSIVTGIAMAADAGRTFH